MPQIDENPNRQSLGRVKSNEIQAASHPDASIRMKSKPTSHRRTEFHRFSHKSAPIFPLLA
jgi:hypothetical protein